MPVHAALFLAQRASALVLAPLVLIHLGLAIYAIHGGLTAAEILGRTQGSFGWSLFYGLFVVAASIHAPIGLRNVLREWLDQNLPDLVERLVEREIEKLSRRADPLE